MRLRFLKRDTASKGMPATTSPSAVAAAATKKKDTTQSYSWEVVDSIDIAPIITASYPSDEYLTKDATLHVGRQDMSRTYVFYVRPKDNQHHNELTQHAVIFARRQLLAEARRCGFNSFIREGWKLTLFRNDDRWRIEVNYTARPAVMAKKCQSHTPPFLEVLAPR